MTTLHWVIAGVILHEVMGFGFWAWIEFKNWRSWPKGYRPKRKFPWYYDFWASVFWGPILVAGLLLHVVGFLSTVVYPWCISTLERMNRGTRH